MPLNEELRKMVATKGDVLTDIIGQDEAKRQLLSALIMDRHVIIVGPPGVGKTTLAKNIAKLLPKQKVVSCAYHCSPEAPICPECKAALAKGKKLKPAELSGQQRFVRVQGSPDLTAEDLIGDIDPIKAMHFGPLSIEAFTPGKIFKANNGVLFFDEINRCPEKLQNAMLQVLEERKVTIGSYDVEIAANFIFIGTMNPKDSSTEKLSDVFLDRFDLVYMSYPESPEQEQQIVISKGKKILLFPDELLAMIVQFIRTLRADERLEKVPGVRASLGLYERSQANAVLRGAAAVAYQDIRAAVLSVLSHRIKLKPSAKYLVEPRQFISEEFERFIDARFSHIAREKGGSP